MTRFVAALILGTSVSLGACGGDMKQYKKADVDIISVQQLPSGQTEILYQPILDSLYYSPGATVREDAGRQKVSFVRCGIKKDCAVDVIAQESERGQVKIVLPSPPENIDLVFSDGEVRLPK